MLRFGRLDGGNVRITGPGEIEQVLSLGSPIKAKGSRMVLGRAGRKVTKAGKVHMTVVLTKAGKARLRRVKGTVTATLTTRVRVPTPAGVPLAPRSSSRAAERGGA